MLGLGFGAATLSHSSGKRVRVRVRIGVKFRGRWPPCRTAPGKGIELGLGLGSSLGVGGHLVAQLREKGEGGGAVDRAFGVPEQHLVRVRARVRG